MKGAREYLAYMSENPEERALTRSLAPAELQAHVKELGFEFTSEELQAEIELGVDLAEDQLDAVAGGSCEGHCGETCEKDYHQDDTWEYYCESQNAPL